MERNLVDKLQKNGPQIVTKRCKDAVAREGEIESFDKNIDLRVEL